MRTIIALCLWLELSVGMSVENLLQNSNRQQKLQHIEACCRISNQCNNMSSTLNPQKLQEISQNKETVQKAKKVLALKNKAASVKQTKTTPTPSSSTRAAVIATTPYPCMPHKCEPDVKLIKILSQIENGLIFPEIAFGYGRKTYWDFLLVNENPSVDGIYQVNCNRLFFYSVVEKNWTDAAADCCSKNMNLLAIETDTEYKCVFKQDSYWQLDFEYWTSASNYKSKRNIKWCNPRGSKSLDFSSFLHLAPVEVDRRDDKSCFYLDTLNKTYLKYADCKDSKKYICESSQTYQVPFPQCPQCIDNKKKRILAEKLYRNILSGNAALVEIGTGAFFKVCGNVYFMSNSDNRVSNTKATEECCKLGFRLVSFQTRKKMECLVNSLDSNKYYGSTSTDWFWTSGTSQGPLSEENFAWCGARALFNSNESLWEKGDPTKLTFDEAGNERCVIKAKSGLKSWTCASTEIFLCEYVAPSVLSAMTPGVTHPTQKMTTPAPKTSTVTQQTIRTPDQCPKFTCIPQVIFKTPNNRTLVNTSPQDDGFYQETCDTVYFFSYISKPWTEAASECCKQSMDLFSITTKENLSCLQEAINSVKNSTNNWSYTIEDFWTSGSGHQKNESFKWCFSSSTAEISDSAKINSQNSTENLNCLSISSSNNFQLSKRNCNSNLPYICVGSKTKVTPFLGCPKSCVANPAKASIVKKMTDFMLTSDRATYTSKDIMNFSTTFFKACDKTYMLADKKVTFEERYKTCCEIGYVPVSIDTTENKCLEKFHDDNQIREYDAWTSAVIVNTFIDKTDAFLCGDKKPVEEKLKFLFQDSFINVPRCVYLTWIPGNVLLYRVQPCTADLDIFCESID